MSAADLNLLAQAAERNSAAVLSLPSAGMYRHYKTRFLCNTSEGYWVEGVPHEQPLIDSLMSEGHPVEISFKSSTQKVTVTTPILRVDGRFQFQKNQTVAAILLRNPEQIKAMQRRNHYRVPVRDHDGITARVWRIGEQEAIDAKPNPATEIPSLVRNLSEGGIGLVAKGANARVVIPGQRLRLELCLPDQKPVLIEGRASAPRQTPAGCQLGIQFQGLQQQLHGRQILTDLTKIIGKLQRDEVKRLANV